MQEKDSIADENHIPDLVFSGMNFTASLLALGALHAGISVGIVITGPPDTTDHPELTSFYPFTYRELPRALKDVHFMLACSSLFPYLYFPQRCLFFTPRQSIDTRLNAAFDHWAGREREQSALVVKTSDIPGPAFPDAFPKKVALVGEYRFDRNMAMLELFGLCLAKGALLLDEERGSKAKHLIPCEPFPSNRFGFECPGSTFPWQNPVRIRRDGYSLLLHKKADRMLFDFVIESQKMDPGFLQNDAKILLEFLPPGCSDFISEKLKEPFLITKKPAGQTLTDESLPGLRKRLKAWQTKLNRELRTNIDVEKALKAMGGKAINGEQFRLLQHECDQQYGLARQTGIAYAIFSCYFYRYQPYIGDMTEEAYALMAEIRNPETLWKKVERNTLQRIYDQMNFPRT
jgi:hypothetical protein